MTWLNQGYVDPPKDKCKWCHHKIVWQGWAGRWVHIVSGVAGCGGGLMTATPKHADRGPSDRSRDTNDGPGVHG